MNDIFILLAVFQLKHLIADYFLQTPYMYLNKGAKKDWFIPLMSHSLVHGIFTFVIILAYNYSSKLAIFAFMFDVITHFITDRWKATQTYTPQQSQFWIALGIDQYIHHIVGIVIVAYINWQS